MVTNLLTPTHIAILLVVLLLLFGAKRIPETGRALGAGMREFKDAITGEGHPTEDMQTQAVTHRSSRPEGPS